jgi:serine protease Do
MNGSDWGLSLVFMSKVEGVLRKWMAGRPGRWLALLAWSCWLAPLPAGAEADVRRDAAVAAIEKVMPSVVNVGTKTLVERGGVFENLLREFYAPYDRRRSPDAQYSLGSGVIIDEDGYVLTNWHVVQRADQIWVKLSDGRVFEAEWRIGTSRSDVALLKLKTKPGDKFVAAHFAADDDLLLGETVMALGNPFGLGGSVSRGILSSKNRRPPAENEPMDVTDWLQTDAAINPGNSGGPLIDLRGDVIGISVAVYREGQGIGFAVPIKRVSEAIGSLFTPEAVKELWFGARFQAGTNGFVVHEVEGGSPAEKAGLRVGDAVRRVNDRVPRNLIELTQAIVGAGGAHEVTLQIQRGSDQRQLAVRLVPESTVFNADLIRQKTGLTLQAITAPLAQRLRLPSTEGFVVSDVDEGSPAARAGLEPGVVIQGFAGRPLTDLRDLARSLYPRKRGDKITLDVMIKRQRGAFIEYRTGQLEVGVN